jgi:hypothetical protein
LESVATDSDTAGACYSKGYAIHFVALEDCRVMGSLIIGHANDNIHPLHVLARLVGASLTAAQAVPSATFHETRRGLASHPSITIGPTRAGCTTRIRCYLYVA